MLVFIVSQLAVPVFDMQTVAFAALRTGDTDGFQVFHGFQENIFTAAAGGIGNLRLGDFFVAGLEFEYRVLVQPQGPAFMAQKKPGKSFRASRVERRVYMGLKLHQDRSGRPGRPYPGYSDLNSLE